MAADKQKGDKYLQMMWGQIGISISILLAMIGFVVTFMISNNGEHANMNARIDLNSSWTRMVYDYELSPSMEQTEINKSLFVVVFEKLQANDSLNMLQQSHIQRLFKNARLARDGDMALDD